jgi:hypothetical protein
MIGEFFKDFDVVFFTIVLAVLLTLDLYLLTEYYSETGIAWFCFYVSLSTLGGKLRGHLLEDDN